MSGFVAVHTGIIDLEFGSMNFEMFITGFRYSILKGAGNISNSSQFKRACKESCIRANEILKAGGSALGNMFSMTG